MIKKFKIKLLTRMEFLMYDLSDYFNRKAGHYKRKRWEIEDG